MNVIVELDVKYSLDYFPVSQIGIHCRRVMFLAFNEYFSL